MRIILDTNVLVRAAKPDSPAREVLSLFKSGPHVLVACPFLFRELERVMNYDRVRAQHRLTQDEIQSFIAAYHEAADVAPQEAEEPGQAISTDPDDNPILQLAVARRVRVICTLDRHFRQPNVQTFCRRHRIRILTDLELLAELRRSKRRQDKRKES